MLINTQVEWGNTQMEEQERDNKIMNREKNFDGNNNNNNNNNKRKNEEKVKRKHKGMKTFTSGNSLVI